MKSMKNMVKLVTVVFSIAAFATVADDYYMYWCVDQTGSDDPYTFAYATLKATDGNGVYDMPSYGTIGADASGTSSGLSAGGLGNMSSLGIYASTAYSFFIELYSDSDVFLAQSETKTYSEIVQAHAISNSGIGQQAAAAWVPGGYAIPEPSSALLVLLGMAGLALRRKRV